MHQPYPTAPETQQRPTGGQRVGCVTNPASLGAKKDPKAWGQPHPSLLKVSKIAPSRVPPTHLFLRALPAASLRAAPGMLLLHLEMAAPTGVDVTPPSPAKQTGLLLGAAAVTSQQQLVPGGTPRTHRGC